MEGASNERDPLAYGSAAAQEQEQEGWRSYRNEGRAKEGVPEAPGGERRGSTTSSEVWTLSRICLVSTRSTEKKRLARRKSRQSGKHKDPAPF